MNTAAHNKNAANADDDEWYEWAVSKMREKPSWKHYESIMLRCIEIARERWRARFNKDTWIRVMKKDRMIKELNEIAPVLDRVVRELNSPAYEGKKTTVIDLCSGFGYFGMFIAELVPADRLDRICLVDNAWPSYGKAPQSHHINHTHIVDNEWPTPLHCCKVDLKKPYHIRNFSKQVMDRVPGPMIMTAVHLCGVLSVRAVEMFNNNPRISMIALKPCCLPPLAYINRNAPQSGLPIKEWLIAKKSGRPAYPIPAKEVCSSGKWVKKVWKGPPRASIRAKFERWAAHLMNAVDVEAEAVLSVEGLVSGHVTDDSTSLKTLEEIIVQQEHWQNLFIFAHRRQGEGDPPVLSRSERRVLSELQKQLAALQAQNAVLRQLA
jgi:hypothetical protein